MRHSTEPRAACRPPVCEGKLPVFAMNVADTTPHVISNTPQTCPLWYVFPSRSPPKHMFETRLEDLMIKYIGKGICRSTDLFPQTAVVVMSNAKRRCHLRGILGRKMCSDALGRAPATTETYCISVSTEAHCGSSRPRNSNATLVAVPATTTIRKRITTRIQRGAARNPCRKVGKDAARVVCWQSSSMCSSAFRHPIGGTELGESSVKSIS
mmetsp:Transcript_36921/g.67632  ORF Transcript_36921/g.67632 Transcript_36921/m.67632 type:complete len:211 (-) Transcript_36921:427-1059(-)